MVVGVPGEAFVTITVEFLGFGPWFTGREPGAAVALPCDRQSNERIAVR